MRGVGEGRLVREVGEEGWWGGVSEGRGRLVREVGEGG